MSTDRRTGKGGGSSSGLPALSGWLDKRGAWNRSWKSRFCNLDPTNRTLYYSAGPNKPPKGCLVVDEHAQLQALQGKDKDTNPLTFAVVTPGRQFRFRALNSTQATRWKETVLQYILHAYESARKEKKAKQRSISVPAAEPKVEVATKDKINPATVEPASAEPALPTAGAVPLQPSSAPAAASTLKGKSPDFGASPVASSPTTISLTVPDHKQHNRTTSLSSVSVSISQQGDSLYSTSDLSEFDTAGFNLEEEQGGLPEIQGFLSKRGKWNKAWKKRWCYLEASSSALYYCSKPNGAPRGRIPVTKLTVVSTLLSADDPDKDPCVFTITSLGEDGTIKREYRLKGDNPETVHAWATTLKAFIHYAKYGELPEKKVAKNVQAVPVFKAQEVAAADATRAAEERERKRLEQQREQEEARKRVEARRAREEAERAKREAERKRQEEEAERKRLSEAEAERKRHEEAELKRQEEEAERKRKEQEAADAAAAKQRADAEAAAKQEEEEAEAAAKLAAQTKAKEPNEQSALAEKAVQDSASVPEQDDDSKEEPLAVESVDDKDSVREESEAEESTDEAVEATDTVQALPSSSAAADIADEMIEMPDPAEYGLDSGGRERTESQVRRDAVRDQLAAAVALRRVKMEQKAKEASVSAPAKANADASSSAPAPAAVAPATSSSAPAPAPAAPTPAAVAKPTDRSAATSTTSNYTPMVFEVTEDIPFAPKDVDIPVRDTSVSRQTRSSTSSSYAPMVAVTLDLDEFRDAMDKEELDDAEEAGGDTVGALPSLSKAPRRKKGKGPQTGSLGRLKARHRSATAAISGRTRGMSRRHLRAARPPGLSIGGGPHKRTPSNLLAFKPMQAIARGRNRTLSGATRSTMFYGHRNTALSRKHAEELAAAIKETQEAAAPKDEEKVDEEDQKTENTTPLSDNGKEEEDDEADAANDNEVGVDDAPDEKSEEEQLRLLEAEMKAAEQRVLQERAENARQIAEQEAKEKAEKEAREREEADRLAKEQAEHEAKRMELERLEREAQTRQRHLSVVEREQRQKQIEVQKQKLMQEELARMQRELEERERRAKEEAKQAERRKQRAKEAAELQRKETQRLKELADIASNNGDRPLTIKERMALLAASVQSSDRVKKAHTDIQKEIRGFKRAQMKNKRKSIKKRRSLRKSGSSAPGGMDSTSPGPPAGQGLLNTKRFGAFGPFKRVNSMRRRARSLLEPHITAGVEVRKAVGMGRGLFATKEFKAGDVVFVERKMFGIESGDNEVPVCGHCMRFVGDAEKVFQVLAGLPSAPAFPHKPKHISSKVVECTQGCGALYCSKKCRLDAWHNYHELLCPNDKFFGKSLKKFYQHVRDSQNERFHLGARVMAYLIKRMERKRLTADEALAAFSSYNMKPWWECVAVPDELDFEAAGAFSDVLVNMTKTSLLFLKRALCRNHLHNKLFVLQTYACILGLFERNNWPTTSTNPLAEYTKHIRTNHPGDLESVKASIGGPGTWTQLEQCSKLVVEGTGLFALGHLINHSCMPNVELSKPDKHMDDTTVVVASRDIHVGEQLFLSYIDQKQKFTQRRDALKFYGFECKCQRCLRDLMHFKMTNPSIVMYSSSVPGSSKVRDNIRRMETLFTANKVQYTTIDLSLPENSHKKAVMASASGTHELPQVFVNDQFRGVAEDFFNANEMHAGFDRFLYHGPLRRLTFYNPKFFAVYSQEPLWAMDSDSDIEEEDEEDDESDDDVDDDWFDSTLQQRSRMLSTVSRPVQ